MNNAMIELAKLFGLNHERIPREVLAEEVCTLALEKIRASAVQIRAGQIQNDCISSALQARNQQCDKLAAVLVEVNEFCQQRGTGKVGDSASAALMQRHDELAAQVERLKHERDEALAYADRLRGAAWGMLMNRTGMDEWHDLENAVQETPPAALAALKAKWQDEAVKEFLEMLDESMGVERDAGRNVSGDTIEMIGRAARKFKQRAQEAGDE